MTSIRTSTALFALGALVSGSALAAVPQGEPTPKRQKPLEEIRVEDLRPSAEDEQAQAQREMIELFERVERRLRLIDTMLLDASAGETTRLNELQSSGMEELLKEAEPRPESQETKAQCDNLAGSLGQSSSQGRRAVQEIDAIIGIAESMPSSCQSGTPQEGKEGEPKGPSPLDKPQGSREKSQSPDRPQEGGQEPGQQQQDPKSGQESPEDGRNEEGQQMPRSETAAPPGVTDQREHWGDLPVHVRDIFRAEGGPGMPAQYRDWIDAYYRRLSSRSAD